MDCLQDATKVSTDVNCVSKKITCGELARCPGAGWREDRWEAPLAGPGLCGTCPWHSSVQCVLPGDAQLASR